MSNYSPFHSTNHTDIFSSMMKNYRINRERAKQILNRNSLKKNICKSSSTSMMSNEPSIHDKVQSFFYDRDRMIFRMFGCHKDEIDEVMETGNSTENFIKGKDKMKISKKKYNFLIKDHSVNLVKQHKEKIKEILRKNTKNKLLSYSRRNESRNNSFIVQQNELLPILVKKEKKLFTIKQIRHIKSELLNKAALNISQNGNKKIDNMYQKRISLILDKNDVCKAIRNVNLKVPLKEIRDKSNEIQNSSLLINNCHEKKLFKRNEQFNILKEKINYLCNL